MLGYHDYGLAWLSLPPAATSDSRQALSQSLSSLTSTLPSATWSLFLLLLETACSYSNPPRWLNSRPLHTAESSHPSACVLLLTPPSTLTHAHSFLYDSYVIMFSYVKMRNSGLERYSGSQLRSHSGLRGRAHPASGHKLTTLYSPCASRNRCVLAQQVRREAGLPSSPCSTQPATHASLVGLALKGIVSSDGKFALAPFNLRSTGLTQWCTLGMRCY